MSEPKVITVGISGSSCSGKTTVALLLKKLLKRAIVINQDEYFKKDDEIPKDENTGLANWDSPSAVNFGALNDAINFARSNPNQLLSKPPVALQNNHHGSDLLSIDDFKELHSVLEQLGDTIFIIVEGFLLFCDEQVSENIDVKCFITASKQTLKTRREARKGYVTLQGYWVDPPHYFDQVVWPQYVLWNDHLIDDRKRDPSIQVMNTDIYSAKDVTTTAIQYLYTECSKIKK